MRSKRIMALSLIPLMFAGCATAPKMIRYEKVSTEQTIYENGTIKREEHRLMKGKVLIQPYQSFKRTGGIQ